MQRESGSPRCPLASTNEPSKIGIHVLPRGKQTTEGKKKTKKNTQNWDLAYTFNVSWCGSAWKNYGQCPAESGRVERTRTSARCACNGGTGASFKHSFQNDLPQEKALPTDTAPSKRPHPSRVWSGHFSYLLPAAQLTPGKLVPAINPLGHGFPQGVWHLVPQFEQDFRPSPLAFHWLVY